VLRVEDRRVLRTEAEDLGVKLVKAPQRGVGGHVIGVGHDLGPLAGGAQILLAQPLNALDAGRQILPEVLHVLRPRHLQRHSDNGDVVRVPGPAGILCTHPEWSFPGRLARPY